MTEAVDNVHRAELLDDDDPDHRRVLDGLRTDARIEFIDERSAQLASLHELRPNAPAELVAEPTRWAYFPWRRAVVGILGRNAFRALRLDRNRNLITPEEQARLGALAIGVVGLSVGHVIAHTLAAQGSCGHLRLADFDQLELSNLNRIPASVLDIGLNKATITARRIAELDPYTDVAVFPSGLTRDDLDDFFDGLDIVVEECDSLEIKALVREAARQRRLPVLMTTSDRGLFDVERYDLEPQRPILHGFLGDMDSTRLAGLTAREKLPITLRHADPTQTSPRITASLAEVGRTLSSWPQLAGEVTLGAAVVAEAVRRIGLGEPLSSGQARVDVGKALDDVREPSAGTRTEPSPGTAAEPDEPGTAVEVIAAAAARAPSGGNAQPWHIEAHDDSVVIEVAPEHATLMNVAHRGSAIAVGAAVFNATVAAAARYVHGTVEYSEGDAHTPLRAVVRLGTEQPNALAALYQPMLQRETNRRLGKPNPIPDGTIAALRDTARREGAQLAFLTRHDIAEAATIFAATDRIRYLTPRLHQELIAELRWPGDQPEDTGIDVLSLELDPSDQAVLQILRRSDVMAELARWDAGSALGDDVSARLRAASAVGVVTVRGSSLIDFARGGAAVEAVWILAQQQGLAVQPLSPAFLHAIHPEELVDMSPTYATDLIRLQDDFRRLAATPREHSHVLVLKFSYAAGPSVRSRRRKIHGVHGTELNRNG